MQATTYSLWTYRRLKGTVIGQYGFLVILLAIRLGFVIIWFQERNRAFDYRDRIVCIPCYMDELQSSDFKGLIGFKRHVSDADYVTRCARLSKVLDQLIEKHAVTKHQSTRIISRLGEECDGIYYNPRNPYAKVTEFPFTNTENDQDLKITRWNTTLERNVKPLGGKIFTIEPGLYYVLCILIFLVVIVLIVLKHLFRK